MRKVYLKLYVDLVVMVDNDVDLNEAINESNLTLTDDLGRFDTLDCNITTVEVTDAT